MAAVRKPIYANETERIRPRVSHIAALQTSCEACGEPTYQKLCAGCHDRARPHIEDDPYDILGGEDGWR